MDKHNESGIAEPCHTAVACRGDFCFILSFADVIHDRSSFHILIYAKRSSAFCHEYSIVSFKLQGNFDIFFGKDFPGDPLRFSLRLRLRYDKIGERKKPILRLKGSAFFVYLLSLTSRFQRELIEKSCRIGACDLRVSILGNRKPHGGKHRHALVGDLRFRIGRSEYGIGKRKSV